MADSVELFQYFHKFPSFAPTDSRKSAHKPSPVLVIPNSSSRGKFGLCCRALDSKSMDGEMFSVTSSSKSVIDYLGESTKGDLNVNQEQLEAFGESLGDA